VSDARIGDACIADVCIGDPRSGGTGIFRTLSGSAIYLEDTGTGRLPVLALHGLGGGAYFFRGFASRLAPRYRVLAVDMPGTGRSTSGVSSWSIASWIDDLNDLIARHIGAPVVIVGHSLGTIVALAGYRAWPQHIRGLVFAGGLPKARSVIVERLVTRAAQVRQSGLQGLGAQVAAGVFSPESLRTRSEVVALFERTFEAQAADAYLRGIEILTTASADDVAPTVGVPALAITGQDDQYAPPDAVSTFVQTLPAARPLHVIPDCGHMPFFESPDVFASRVESFLDTL